MKIKNNKIIQFAYQPLSGLITILNSDGEIYQQQIYLEKNDINANSTAKINSNPPKIKWVKII